MGSKLEGGRPKRGESRSDVFYRARDLLRIKQMLNGPPQSIAAAQRIYSKLDILTAGRTSLEEIIAMFGKAAALPVEKKQSQGFHRAVAAQAAAAYQKRGRGGKRVEDIAEDAGMSETAFKEHKSKLEFGPAVAAISAKPIIERLEQADKRAAARRIREAKRRLKGATENP